VGTSRFPQTPSTGPLRGQAASAAGLAIRPAPAISGAPPVDPALPRPPEIPGARDVGRNTVETLLFRGLSTPVALLLVVVQSRFLEPEGRGEFVLVVLSVTILSRLLGQLGLAVTNRLQDVPATEVRPLVHRAFALGAVLGGAGMAAIILWGSQQEEIGATTAAIAAAALIPNVVWQTISGVLLGLARVRAWNYIQALSPLLTLAGMLVLVVALGGDVRAAVVAWTVAHFLTAAFALVAARDLVVPVDLPPFLDSQGRTILRLALVMGAVQVVNLIGYRVELFLLEHYDGVAAVGVYSIAMQAAEAMWLIPAAIATAITGPVVHEPAPEAVRRVRNAALRALAYTGGAAVAVGAVAPFLIPLLFGDAFAGAARPLAFLLPGVVVYGSVTVLVVYISVRRGLPRLSLVVSVAGMLVTAAASIPLIGAYGKTGAAAASSVGYFVAASLAWIFFARLARRGEDS
jgi:O-antigen/teichoic acid export membrane protein